MAREGTPVLGLPFSWVFLPFVLLLLALVVRSALAASGALLRRRNWSTPRCHDDARCGRCSAVLAGGMLLRAPIGFSMLAAGIAYLVVKRQDLGLAAEQVCNGLYNSYVLLAVPLFVLAANLMNAGTISERIFDFCRILVGRLRGGLAQVDILVSVIFSGMSGSAIADAAGPGLVTIRQMLKKPEYSPRLRRRGGGGQRHARARSSRRRSRW